MRSLKLALALIAILTIREMPDAQSAPAAIPALERQIPRVTLQLGPDGQRVAGAIEGLWRAAVLPPMGVEAEPSRTYRPAPSTDARQRTLPPPPESLTVGPGTLGAALQELRARLPQYDIWVEGGVVGIAPSVARGDPKHFLNTPIPFFRVKDITFHRAVTTLLNQLEPSVRIGDWRETPTSGSVIFIGPVPPPDVELLTRRYMERPVTLSVTEMSARDILNRLVALNGEMIWMATYEDPGIESLPQAVQGNCVLRFFPTSHGTSSASVSLRTTTGTASLDPGAAIVRPPAPPPAARPPVPAGAVRVTMNLPAQPENLVTVAARLGASARRAFGIEVVTSGQPAAPASGERSIYDLTGLSLPDALNKIMEFIPGYASSAQSDVVHVRPKGADGPVPTVLDRRVPKFAGRFENLQLAMRAVSALISGAADPSVVPAFGNFPPAAWSDEVKALVTRPVEIDLTDVTIRQILDEVARKHGAMSWAVIHRGSIDGPQGLQLVFLGFEQWSVNTTTRIGR